MEDLYRTLPKLLRLAPEAEEIAEAAVFAAWRRVAGEGLRSCTVPYRLTRKTLVVAVSDTAWRRQMEPLRWNLLNRINALLEQTIVTNIEFRIDPQTVRTARGAPPPTAAEQAQRQRDALTAARDLNHAADSIQDAGLRERFLLAAGSCLDARNK